jgi:NTP pyrophosphatase (non-canonical NTP hydrolase)
MTHTSTSTYEVPTLDHTYELFVNGKFKSMPSAKEDLLHAVIGISGEAGEVLDAIKKHYFYNKPLDLENVIEELGDIEFYMQAMRMCLSLDRKQILIHNMEKLSKRYGTGSYSDAQAQARLDKQEQGETK